ncbi:Peroxin 13, N-terminal region-domain-containing protein [Hysterangium stoloniferum]|nr:Peroxin 13, N-terminal region-domain-containing protein [Hysterangium stoloniferum]
MFVEIDIVADFERTSLGLARLGEWESKTTSSDMEPINNAMGVKSATTTVDGSCTKTEGNEVEDAELDLGPQAHTSSGFSHPSFRITPHSHISYMQRHTLALIPTIVQTFGCFSQMLERMYMATHSSFFAMVGVAEQFGLLRNALGSVLGAFEMIRGLLPRPSTGQPPFQTLTYQSPPTSRSSSSSSHCVAFPPHASSHSQPRRPLAPECRWD